MKTYELMSIFRTKENGYETGVKAVKEILAKYKAEIKSENDMKDRELAYLVKKEDRGHYHLFTMTIDQTKLVKMEEELKLVNELLKYIVVNIEE